jgi:protocatechuate 3,4-dioxygenase beta subunit
MAKNRTTRWLALLALFIVALGVLLLRELGRRPDTATSAAAGEAADPTRSRASAVFGRAVDEPPDEENAADGLSLIGRVIYRDGRPAEGAEVYLLSRPSGAPRAGMPRRVVHAEPDGSFAFAKQAQGDYRLEAHTEDAFSPTVSVRLLPGAKPVTLVLFPAAGLSVHVYDASDHKSIAGATVKLGIGNTLFGASDAYRQETTDEKGIAHFRGVAPVHNHPIYAVADGYAGNYSNILARDHLLLDWQIEVPLQAGAQVSGRVVDERHQPIAGAKVGWEPGKGEAEGAYHLFTPLADGGHYIAAATDASGTFRKGVPPGFGCVVAVHGRYLIGQVCGLRAEIGRPVTGVEIVLKAGARVSGTVVTSEGKPVPRAEVIVTQPTWEHVPMFSDTYRLRTTTDSEGRFAFEGVDRIAVALTAWTDEGSSDLVELDLRGVDERKDVRITIAYAGAISGTVAEEDGRPVPYAMVNYFLHPDFEKIAPGYTGKTQLVVREFALPKSLGGALCDGEGRFRLTGLPPGRYTLRATRPDANSVAPEYSGVYKYEVATGQEVTLTLPALGSLAGRVATDDGRPLTAFHVAFAIWGPEMETGALPSGRPVVSTDGSFQIDDVPANHYAIAISAPGAIEWRKAGGVAVRGGRVTNLGTIRLVRGRSIGGRVLSSRGDPVGAAAVAMIASDHPDVVVHAESDDTGHFTLPTVARDAAIRVRASNQEAASDWMTVPADAQNVDITLSSAARGGVRGVIIDPAHPVAERVVVLTLTGRGTPTVGLQVEATTHALDGGRFAFESVTAGQYLLWVRRAQGVAGDEWASRAITVESMKETSVVIDLGMEPQP